MSVKSVSLGLVSQFPDGVSKLCFEKLPWGEFHFTPGLFVHFLRSLTRGSQEGVYRLRPVQGLVPAGPKHRKPAW